ncbi:exported hypothetical protein [Tenacibaculum litopenaei]|uniref:hypothetical protein n=1 Tax=Tenacibaculum litopenaei TaxID=396016 RepID=UPI003893E430
MIKKRVILGCLLLSLSSCRLFFESQVSMRRFNNDLTNTHRKLEKPVLISLIYEPKINIHIDREQGEFLQKVDSSFIKAFPSKLMNALKDVNIIPSETGKPQHTIYISELILSEATFEGTDSNHETTTELAVELLLSGYIHDVKTGQNQPVKAYLHTQTHSGSSLMMEALFNDTTNYRKNDSYTAGTAENNLIKLFARKCASKLSSSPSY